MTDREAGGHALPREMMRYYALGREATRFAAAAGELEYVRTQEIIKRFLPTPPAVVLDVGGGPGVYAQWLAGEGYEVHLIDAVPLHLEQARAASQSQLGPTITTMVLGDARELAHDACSADVVLLMGPLYHLIKRSDRLLALREAFRVLKRGGVLMAVGISRFASTLAGLTRGSFGDETLVAMAQKTLANGQHRNPTGEPGHFTTSFLHHPHELRAEVRQAGFTVQTLLAIEGVAVFLQDLEERWQDPARRGRILDAVRWLEDEASVMGVTGHIAAVATKPR